MTDKIPVPSTTSAGAPLFAAMFVTVPIHIPDDDDGAYKTELVIKRDPATETLKVLWWHGSDPRTTPHNHPWKDKDGISFVSEILSGGYTEDRYTVVDGRVVKETKSYRAGDKNIVPYDSYHYVYDVRKDTCTWLRTGPAVPGNVWGYLDPETGLYSPYEKDPTFLGRLQKLNPHLRLPR